MLNNKTQKNKRSFRDLDFSLVKVSVNQKMVFAKYLSIMLKSGLTISEALGIVYDQAGGRFKKIVLSIEKSVQSGNSFSDSLRQYPKVFSDLFINTVYAGEVSGTLEENLNNISEQMKKEKELFTEIKSAMVYPIIIVVATIVLGLAMAFLVLPKITPLFEGMEMELPITTKALIWVSQLIQENGLIILIAIFVFTFFFVWLLRQKFIKPLTHFIVLKTPIVRKISYNVNLARFCRTLAMLLKSGLNIDKAIGITMENANNYYYKKTLKKVCKRVGQGSAISSILAEQSKYFPKLAVSMIKVGEKSGNLEKSLFYLADIYDSEVDTSTKVLSTVIEPLLLIVIGLLVGGMALSIITPMYQMTGGITR